ncbi:restriction endonuclease subunit S [Thioalkalivibrio sp. ARh3]|uniref:restriction endonuclease subunit S n=1 Tax=Thioalkalivibrio sp. ARh3 TaxID=1158148 RepID=UPI00035E5342|nr:restriction endonuclease subunit S [Thioalkalivibrio sp. ARh3]
MKEGWTVRPLHEVCEIKPPKREVRTRLEADDPVSFVPMNDLGIREKWLLPKQERPLSSVAGSYTYFADGDVLIAKITPCFENGKLGVARGLTNGVGFGSSEFVVLRPTDALDAEFLFYFLSQDSFRDAGSRVMSGAVGHKRVPKEFIQNVTVPIPPLTEQKRIVATLDEAFAGIATALANTEKNLANARELFESYLNAFFSQQGEEWEERSLADVCVNLDSKRVPITKSKRMPGGIPYYGASGVVDHVADYIFDEDLLLVSEDGANLLARTYPIAFSISGKSWVNNHAHVLRFDAIESQRFIEYYLNSISLEPYVSGMAQPKLNQKALNSIKVPFPSVDQQRVVVEKLDEIASGKRQLSDIYRQKLNALSELRQSLLQKAFSGELTAGEAASDAMRQVEEIA